MPTAADKLSKDSSPEATDEAISACVSQMMQENPDWDNDRAVAACHSMARRATGNEPGVREKSSSRVG